MLEVGPILKAIDMTASPSRRPPNAHRLFSKMEFVRGGNSPQVQQLDENDEPMYNGGDEEAQTENFLSSVVEKRMGGWLESDDIEDFD
jgi:cell cycle checkpoint protein